nr:AsmA-like C-terminal region-containing protein [uncultured Cohaesibacter sp.]
MANRLDTSQEQDGPPEPHSPSPDALPKVRQRSRLVRRTLFSLGALVVVLALIIGGVGLRLYYAPLSISSFKGEIEALVVNRLPQGQRFRLSEVLVGLSENGRLALQLSDVTLSEGDDILLSAPKIDLEVGLLALLKRQIRARSINILSMKVKVRRDLTGRLLIAGQDPSLLSDAAPPDERLYDPNEPDFVSVLNAVRRAIKPLADDDLNKRPPQILIRNTQIHFRDEVIDKEMTYENVAFAYNPLGEDDNLWRIDFAYDGRHGRIHSAMGESPITTSDKKAAGRSIQLVFENISLADILPRFAGENHNFSFSSAFAGRAQLDFNEADTLAGMRMELDVGEGLLEFGEKDEAYLNSATLRFVWAPKTHQLRLLNSTVFFGETGGSLRGVAAWPDSLEGNIQVQLLGQNLKLAARDNPYPSRMLNALSLQARIDRQTHVATVDDFRMVADEGSVSGNGTIAMINGELALNMGFDISQMPYDLLLHMWPVNIANGARKWLIKNLRGGITTGGHFDLALTESMLKRNEEGRLILPDDSVHGTFGFTDAKLKPFGDLPESEKLSGQGVVTGRTFHTSIDSGEFVTKSGLLFPVSKGRFEIPDHSQKPATGVLVLDGEGDAVAFGEIVDSDPLNTLKQEKQKASDLSGKASAKVRLSFPFIDPLRLEDVDYDAQITLRAVDSKAPLRGHSVANADVVINTDGKRMDIKGQATVDGVRAALELISSTDDSVVSSSSFDMVLNDADRSRFGLGLEDWLRGPVSVRAIQRGDRPNVTTVEADLTKAELDLKILGWSKKPNVRGSAGFDLVDKGDHFSVENLSVSGDGFDASGAVEIDKDDGLQSLRIDELVLSRGDRLSVDVTRNGQGPYHVNVDGDVLDLRGKLLKSPFIANDAKGGEAEDAILNARIKKVIGLSGHAITGLIATVQVENGMPRNIQLNGMLDGSNPIEVTTKMEQYPTVHLDASDAGNFLRFLGAIDRVVGGRLALSVALQKGLNTISGAVSLRDFKISGQVERHQSSKATTQNVDSGFDAFSVQYQGNKGVFNLSRGILKGPVLGATVDGTIDLKSRILNLSGTYIPAYRVNNIFSRLPIIGRALGNRKNEGLLGITYVVKGDMANPTLIVNPASLLAPGVFRKIFEF